MNFKKGGGIVFAAVIFLTMCSSELKSMEIMVAGIPLTVEVADTPDLRSKGLMNRRHLAPDEGMLFVFEKEERPSFWMKDTRIPLSIAFIASDGTIRQIEPLKPFSLQSVHSNRYIRYALELNHGWFERHGVAVGDKVMLSF